MQGTLPLRLLSLRYGADLVYGEEIVDKRIISAVRVPNGMRLRTDSIRSVPPTAVSIVRGCFRG